MMTLINESGLYSLILRSRKPEAKQFKKWVTSEVLPSIRKNLGLFKGHAININDGMINLTNMWKACGEEEEQRPSDWFATISARKLLISMEENPKYREIRHLTTAKRGNGGGTYVHPQIGLAYAKYLSPEFHIWCNEKLLESGLIEVSEGEMLVKLGEDGLPVGETSEDDIVLTLLITQQPNL